MRKHQKIIFGFLTVMVISSFLFFGTYDVINRSAATKETPQVIGTALDGSKLYKHEVAALVQAIDLDIYDALNGEGRQGPNIFNDGFVRTDLLKAGLGAILVEKLSGELEGEVKGKIGRFRQYKPYMHPSKAFGAEKLWKQFMPAYSAHYERFKEVAKGEDVKEAFGALVDLYIDQSEVPVGFIHGTLMYLENQYAGQIAKDPNLPGYDFALFHARGLSEWFGPKFTEAMAEFIHNGALFAEAQGYEVSTVEVKERLFAAAAHNLRQVNEFKDVDDEALKGMAKRHMARMGVKESDMIEAWRKVYLVRKMLDEVGSGVVVDSLMYEQIHEKESSGAKIELYRLPRAFRFEKAEDAMKLEIYLDAIAGRRDASKFPEKFLAAEAILEAHPELVERQYVVRVMSVKRSELLSQIGVRQTWDWELEEHNWKVLQKEFSEVAKCKEVEANARFAFLQMMEETLRDKVDEFARVRILEENPSWVQEALGAASGKQRVLAIAQSGEGDVLPGLSDRKALLELLEAKSEKLACYTEDGKVLYRIEVLDRGSNWDVLTFEEAETRGILDAMLEKKLKKNPHAFDSLKEGWKEKNIAMVAQQRELVLQGNFPAKAEKSRWKEGEKLTEREPLSSQWQLEREERKVLFSEKSMDDRFASMLEGEWSQTLFLQDGPVFYRVVEKFTDRDGLARRMEEGRRELGKEAKRELMERMTTEMCDKGAIVFNGS